VNPTPGDRLEATLTGRQYRLLSIAAEANAATVVAPPDGDCRAFSVPLDELAADLDAGKIEVVE
jgi:hypothetical protein